MRDVGTDAEESFAGAAIFDGVLRFLDGRSVKFNGGDSRPGIQQAKRGELSLFDPHATLERIRARQSTSAVGQALSFRAEAGKRIVSGSLRPQARKSDNGYAG